MAPSSTDPPPASRDASRSSAVQATSPLPTPPRRESTIRFSDDTVVASRSPMSRGWRDPDEITPIRGADDAQGRTYNTTTSDRTPAKPRAAQTTSPANSSDGNEDENEDKPQTTPWYKRVAEKYGSVSLENKGSVARDHLALERTFLAWLRTSLAFASIGIAVTQLFRLNTTSASRTQAAPLSSTQVPFSPYLCKAIPPELLPYLQEAAGTAAGVVQTLGPTLLDQLLLLPPNGVVPAPSPFKPVDHTEFDEDAAKRLRHVGKPLGATFLAISIVILFIGFHRYFESQHWIIRGKFPASRGSIFLVAFIAGALIIASLIVVLVVAPTSFQKK